MNIQAAQELVGRLFSVIDGNHFDALHTVFAPEAVYERPGYEPLAGLERIEHFYRRERVIASGQHQVEDVTCSAQSVICYGRFVGQSRDGAALSERFADVYQTQAGRITRRTTYFFRPAI